MSNVGREGQKLLRLQIQVIQVTKLLLRKESLSLNLLFYRLQQKQRITRKLAAHSPRISAHLLV